MSMAPLGIEPATYTLTRTTVLYFSQRHNICERSMSTCFITKTGHGVFLRPLHPVDPSIIGSTLNVCHNSVQSIKRNSRLEPNICIRIITRAVRKVKNVCAYNPRSCFIVPDQSFGVFSRV